MNCFFSSNLVTQVLIDSEPDQDQMATPQDIDDLFFDSDSDSGPEMDTVSVMSTPKPKLRYSGASIFQIFILGPGQFQSTFFTNTLLTSVSRA